MVRHLVVLRGGMSGKEVRAVTERLAKIPDDEGLSLPDYSYRFLSLWRSVSPARVDETLKETCLST
jgi:hypothetical protein